MASRSCYSQSDQQTVHAALCEAIKHLKTNTTHSDTLPTTTKQVSCHAHVFVRHYYHTQTKRKSVKNE